MFVSLPEASGQNYTSPPEHKEAKALTYVYLVSTAVDFIICFFWGAELIDYISRYMSEDRDFLYIVSFFFFLQLLWFY